MKKWRYITPVIALSLITLSCKDKQKTDAPHPNEQEEPAYPTSSTDVTPSGEDGSDVMEPMDEGGPIEGYSDNVKSSNEQKDQKFRGVQSDLRDFSDDPESAKKDALREIAGYQDQLQSIAFNGKSDFKKAEELSRKISSLFASIGAKDESKRWLETAESYHKQAQR